MKRALITILVVVLLSTVALVGYRAFAGDRNSAPTTGYETVTVGRNTLVSTVSATGAIAPEQKLALNFKSAGRVAAVYVREGDNVAAGQVLAELEAADLVLQVRAAQANLAIAEARLEQLLAPAFASEVAAAEAQLASAQAVYRELLAGPNADQVALAQVQLEKAQAALAQAQAAYDQVRNAPNIGALPQSLQLQQATLDYQAAEANYRVATQSATQAQIAQALAQVAQAQANLDRLRRGAAEADIKVAEAQVEQARVQLEQAEYALGNAQIKSPISGIVAQVNIKVGELTAGGGTPSIVVQDESRFPLDVYVDEIDIGRVREGQAVEVSIDAFTGTTVPGHIAAIAPAASLESGVSAYKVTILLDETELPLRVGMSATAFITVETIESVVAVPNRAVRLDRVEGKAYVTKLVDGAPVQYEVRLGARTDTLSQILAGVQEGDVLIIGDANRLQQLQQGFFGN